MHLQQWTIQQRCKLWRHISVISCIIKINATYMLFTLQVIHICLMWIAALDYVQTRVHWNPNKGTQTRTGIQVNIITVCRHFPTPFSRTSKEPKQIPKFSKNEIKHWQKFEIFWHSLANWQNQLTKLVKMANIIHHTTSALRRFNTLVDSRQS